MHRLFNRVFGAVPGVRWLVGGIVAVAIGCAVVAHWIAKDDFPTFGRALWWSVQTVTTVGYGDATPTTNEGKAVAAVLMVAAVAFISILTATIAAGFVHRQQMRRGRDDPLREAMDRIERRLAALEDAVRSRSAPDG
jgi:voltage-gated potassium channel